MPELRDFPIDQSPHEKLLVGIYLAEINMDAWALKTNKPDIEEKIRAELIDLMKGNSGQHVGFLRGLLVAEIITKQCYEMLVEKRKLTEAAHQKALLEYRIAAGGRQPVILKKRTGLFSQLKPSSPNGMA